MPSPRLAATPRRARTRPRPLVLLVALVAATLTLGSSALPTASAHHAGSSPGPVNAASTYGWAFAGGNVWDEAFKSRSVPKRWKKSGRGQVATQHAMLTLNATRNASVSATRNARGHRYGRWEVRLRSKRFERRGADFRVLTELVPTKTSARHCGARNIALERFRIGSHHAGFYTRTMPGHTFHASRKMSLRNDKWNTYAVEVTPHHVSWFVNAHVVRTEKRDAAVSGLRLTPRFTMKAVPGRRMSSSRMQMDWIRHFSLKSHNKKSIRAPHANAGRYRGGC